MRLPESGGSGFDPYHESAGGGDFMTASQSEAALLAQAKALAAAKKAGPAAYTAALAKYGALPSGSANAAEQRMLVVRGIGMGKRKIMANKPPHPQTMGLQWGGKVYAPGYFRRIPKADDPADTEYRYYFMYNPYAIDVSTGVNLDTTFSPADVGTYLFAGAQNINFSTLVNRINDMHYPERPGANFHKEGTGHDLEALFSVINGPASLLKPETIDPNQLIPAALTADIGFLSPTPVEIIFGPGLHWTGVINSVNVAHKSFNHEMIPMLTEVAFAVVRVAGVQSKFGLEDETTAGGDTIASTTSGAVSSAITGSNPNVSKAVADGIDAKIRSGGTGDDKAAGLP